MCTTAIILHFDSRDSNIVARLIGGIFFVLMVVAYKGEFLMCNQLLYISVSLNWCYALLYLLLSKTVKNSKNNSFSLSRWQVNATIWYASIFC